VTPSPSRMYPELLRNDFAAFVHRSFLELNPQTPYLHNWHLDVLAAKLEEVRHGTCRRLIINIPPRHLKSHAASIAFPAWLLGHNPAKKILSLSYGQDLSESLARSSRTLMLSPFYQALFATRLSEGRHAVADFETTEGGARLSTSVGGAVTGHGADVIIVDDPIKAEDVLSETLRNKVNSWFAGTLRSRLNSQEKGAIIIVMQRLHADDLVAHVQENDKWDVLSFPLLAEKVESYDILSPYGRRTFRRSIGDVLHPTLLPLAEIENLRLATTEYNFAAQYQQDPQPPAGLIVRRAWLHFYTPVEKPDTFDQILQSWDTANSDSAEADFSVCTTWGIHGQHLYLLDVYRKKIEFPELKRTVRELAMLWKAGVVLIENKASGISLIQELRADGFSIVQQAPDDNSSKIMRLRGQTAKIEGGFARFPEKAVWLDAYLLELTTFPNSKKDDQVDSTVYALAWSTQEANTSWANTKRFIDMERAGWTSQSVSEKKMTKIRVPDRYSTYYSIEGRQLNISADGTTDVTEAELQSMLANGSVLLD
jgi:predicted phage terminase large subunit-like protein